ncbi:type I-E CRISPR-associated protein Cas5/CasD [Oceanithermus sp.]
MATLLLKLVGPMQSWGSHSRFDYRDTEREPTKSGVLGLVAAALGRDRSEPVDDLASLRLGVRVDREGSVAVDFQTAQDVIKANVSREKWERARSKGKTTGTQDTVVSRRQYLADAAFLVGLEGDGELLRDIEDALHRPRWALFLGRKGYVPAEPVYFAEGGIQQEGLEAALARGPLLIDPTEKGDGVRYVVELSPNCNVELPWQIREIWDQPLGPFARRAFGARRVGEVTLPWGKEPLCT